MPLLQVDRCVLMMMRCHWWTYLSACRRGDLYISRGYLASADASTTNPFVVSFCGKDQRLSAQAFGEYPHVCGCISVYQEANESERMLLAVFFVYVLFYV